MGAPISGTAGIKPAATDLMHYTIRDTTKSFSLARGHRFTVTDQDGHVAFYLVNKKKSKRLSLQLPNGDEVALIGKRETAAPKACEIFQKDKLVAVVQWENFAIKQTVAAVFAASEGGFLEVCRAQLGYTHVFVRDEKILASVTRRQLLMAATFDLEIADSVDAVLILACVLALVCFVPSLI
jgi:uncharacterized protein YxjI